MKKFFMAFHEMIGEKIKYNKISNESIQLAAEEYQCLSEGEQEKCIQILYETLQKYDLIIYYMSTLLALTQDRKILHFLERMLHEKEYSLWDRLNDMLNMQVHLFCYPNLNKEEEEYQNLKNMYQNILDQILSNMKNIYSYIPYEERNKNVVIVVKQLLSMQQAPTKVVRYFYNYFNSFGYDVACFVCFLKAEEGYWHTRARYNNFLDETGFFQCKLNDTKINGYNLVLHSSDYIEKLEYAVGIIRDKKPEFILEIGDQTILAGLCTGFTTVVSMGCTKKLPVTNAPIIATLDHYTKQEQAAHKKILGNTQHVVETACDFLELNMHKHRAVYTKKTFGIKEDDFLILIAGNRLDYEINHTFIEIIYRILDLDDHIVIAFLGECEKLERQIANDRIFFWGYQSNFREIIAIGDIFLNPPRQGGGTGGLFALMEEVPIVTLGDCDVEITAGDDFTCVNLEEMPQLIYRYFSDKQFMEQQKENCRKRAKIWTNVNNEQYIQNLCDEVKKYAAGMKKDKK